jgi:hypothetical protein
MMKNIIVTAILVILLGLLLLSCSNNTSNTGQPIAIVSVSSVGPPNPGGPTVKITLKNVGTEPVTLITCILQLDGEKTFTYNFPDVSSSTPLPPDGIVSQTLNLIGPTGYNDETFYPLQITVIMENGKIVAYSEQVQVK